MSPARRELHAVALRIQQDAEELAVRAEVTRDADTDLAANIAIQNWLVIDMAVTTGTDEDVEVALDLIREDFPQLLTN